MRKVFLVILVLNLVSCKSQVKKKENTSEKNNTMEYFDISKYKVLEVDDKYSSSGKDLYLKDDKLRIKILYLNDVIQIEETSIENKFQLIKVFFESNKSLKIVGSKFYNFSIGKWEYYDEKGQLIKEINYDLDYKLTINDLAKNMKDKYNLDIMDVKKTDNVNRYIDSQKTKLPLYEIYYNDNTQIGILNCYVINGNTGDVLFKTTRLAETEEKQGSLYQKFIESYDKK
ncbi:hypothetical protein AR687_17180 [Flavobacteriaceae bacterium CRH]|nr:hypothetical protein AR687_17180 [Flavobacteriaceae bacterium CRH]